MIAPKMGTFHREIVFVRILAQRIMVQRFGVHLVSAFRHFVHRHVVLLHHHIETESGFISCPHFAILYTVTLSSCITTSKPSRGASRVRISPFCTPSRCPLASPHRNRVGVL